MASDKHILMFDETTGMLTKEVMMAYVYGELPQKVRDDVDRFLAADEMHRDIIEGLRQIPDRNHAEKAVQAINGKISAKTGAAASGGGFSLESFDFFSKYKIAAALAGVLLLSGIVYTLLMMNQESPPLTAKDEKPEQETTAGSAETERQGEENSLKLNDSTGGLIAQANEALLNKESENEETPDANSTTISSVSPPEILNDLKFEAKGEAVTKEKNKRETSAASNGLEKDSSLLLADKTTTDDVHTASGGSVNEKVVSGEVLDQEKYKEEQYVKGGLMNTSKAEERWYADAVTIADEMPVFPGGETAMRQYIKTNLQYPKRARNKGIQGKVYVNFVVDNSGKVRDVRVIQGLDKDMDAEAVRLINSMPVWTPGKQDGKPVTVKQYLTIDFTIE